MIDNIIAGHRARHLFVRCSPFYLPGTDPEQIEGQKCRKADRCPEESLLDEFPGHIVA